MQNITPNDSYSDNQTATMAKPVKPKKGKIFSPDRYSKLQLGLFALFFGVLGGYLILHSFASVLYSVTFKGSLSSRTPTQSYSVTAEAGQLDANLTFSTSQALQLDVISPGGTTVATKNSPTSFSLSAPLSAGTYQVRVSAPAKIKSKINYTLKLTYPISDTTPPTVSIASPSNGATVSGTVQVIGTASDNLSLSKVEVQLDSGVWQAANGTSNWTYSLNSTGFSNGSHILRARSTDSANNVSASTSLSLNFNNAQACSNNGTSTGNDFIINNFTSCSNTASYNLVANEGGPNAEHGNLTATFYRDYQTSQYWLYIRDSVTGNYTNINISDGRDGNWYDARLAWTSQNQIWVFSQIGAGGSAVRGYQVNATDSSGLPTSLSQIDYRTFGDSLGRTGDMIALKSGAVVVEWHQQSFDVPGFGIAYRSPTGTWTSLPMMNFTKTISSREALAQHPADDSIWLFDITDGTSRVAAVHMTEITTGLRVDWTNSTFIGASTDGIMTPDGENPDINAEPDYLNKTIVLAYESGQDRQYFGCKTCGIYGKTWITGSYPILTSVKADSTKSGVRLPIYVERVSGIGLSVNNGTYWINYHPIDNNNGTYSYLRLQASKYSNGAWSTPVNLGALPAENATCTTPCIYGTGVAEATSRSRPEIIATMDDDKNIMTATDDRIHFLIAQ